MAKTYKKISGTWYPIKKIFKRISGAWSEIKKLYQKVSGTWQVVHSGAYEYTFTANASNVDFATLIGATAVANNTDFIITVNSGVTISGTNGAAGANGVGTSYIKGNFGTRVCKDSQPATYAGSEFTWTYGNNYAIDWCSSNPTWGYAVVANRYATSYCTNNGGTGGYGNVAINFSGMSGKKITITNNGTIRGGNGGAGGIGAKVEVTTYTNAVYGGGYGMVCALSGNGGNGAVALYNPTGNTITTLGNAPINGSVGALGAKGHTFIQHYNTSCCDSGE